MAEKKEAKAAKVVVKSKKPMRPGINSGRMLEARTQAKNVCGQLARACDSTFKSIKLELLGLDKTLTDIGADELLGRFPADIDAFFNEKTRNVETDDVSHLKRLEKALGLHEKKLNGVLKSIYGIKNAKRDAERQKQNKNKKPVRKGPQKPFNKQTGENQFAVLAKMFTK